MKKLTKLTLITTALLTLLVGCGNKSSKETTSETTATTQSSEKKVTTASSESSSTSSTTSESTTQSTTSSSQSVSTSPVTDSDIEAIKTYNDYITIYGKIVNHYLDSYKAKLDEYGLADDATFQSMKDGVEQGIQQQKDAYGSMGTKKLLGKEELVKFLKEYRDELQTYVDSVGQ